MFENLWIEKYRPQALEDVVLSDEHRELFETYARQKEIPNLLFAGTPGTGKTSLAKVIVGDILKCQYLYINASDENGVDTIRNKVIGFSQTKSIDGQLKTVLLDEADAISLEGQKALRNVMEEFADTTRFVLTCNYLHKIILPLQSRCQVINLIPPVEQSVVRVVEILKNEKVSVPTTQKPLLLDYITKTLPDMRRIIGDIQRFSCSGELKIGSYATVDLAQKVWRQVKSKATTPTDIRTLLITSEAEFGKDYCKLLRGLFDEIYNDQTIKQEKAVELMIVVAEAMKSDAFVVDKEINCFACLLELLHNFDA